MATLKEIREALKKVNGRLVDESAGYYTTLQAEAPEHHTWDGELHAFKIEWLGSKSRPEFPDEKADELEDALERIQLHADEIQPCPPDCDCYVNPAE